MVSRNGHHLRSATDSAKAFGVRMAFPSIDAISNEKGKGEARREHEGREIPWDISKGSGGSEQGNEGPNQHVHDLAAHAAPLMRNEIIALMPDCTHREQKCSAKTDDSEPMHDVFKSHQMAIGSPLLYCTWKVRWPADFGCEGN